MSRMVVAGLFMVFGTNLYAQSAGSAQPAGEDRGRGVTAYVAFQGSSNSLGQVMEVDSSAGYNFNQYFGIDLGLPVYFVKASGNTTSGGSTSSTGIGDVHMDFRLNFRQPIVNYLSVFTVSAPTGNADAGFSTGRATFDWNNHFDRSFGRVTPFVEIGVANTISNTQFFNRPFTTLGLLSHYQVGGSIDFRRVFSVGASAYAIVPTGQQTVFSQIVRGSSSTANPNSHAPVFATTHETKGTADIDRDNGFSTWIGASPSRYIDLRLGYTHSVHYALDTVTFGVGFNLATLVRNASAR
jgi:hypothetical protein